MWTTSSGYLIIYGGFGFSYNDDVVPGYLGDVWGVLISAIPFAGVAELVQEDVLAPNSTVPGARKDMVYWGVPSKGLCIYIYSYIS